MSDVLVYLRMPLFAFLSGFVYALRPLKGEVPAFIGSKVRRLLIPMLTVGTLFAIVQANTPGANGGRYDWTRLHIEPVAHYWFLESLFIVFLVIVALERQHWLSGKRSFAAVWLAAAALYLLDPLPVYFGMRGAVYLLPYVLVGIACQRFGDAVDERRARLAAAALLCGAAVAAYALSSSWPVRNSAFALALGASGCVFLLYTRVQVRWLAVIGTYSFSIFLFHSVFSAASRIFLTRLFDGRLEVLLVSGIVAGLTLPIVVELLIRRIDHPIGYALIGQKRPRRQPPNLATPTTAF